MLHLISKMCEIIKIWYVAPKYGSKDMYSYISLKGPPHLVESNFER